MKIVKIEWNGDFGEGYVIIQETCNSEDKVWVWTYCETCGKWFRRGSHLCKWEGANG